MKNTSIILPAFLISISLGLQACKSENFTNEVVTNEAVTDPEQAPQQEPEQEPQQEPEQTSEPPKTDTSLKHFNPVSLTRIADNEGGLTASLESGDRFGRDHDNVGDIDGDGVSDLIIGARSDDDGATDAGAAYILFMNSDGSVKTNQKISATQGGFTGSLIASNFFGYGVAGIGDYNGDNIPDVAVSAPAGGSPSIFILHLNTNGTVKSMTKHDGIVAQGLSAVGDLNNDGKIDLAAADPNGGVGGLVHLLFFNDSSQLIQNDTVSIGEGLNGFGTGLIGGDSFGGRETALLGDLDNNGTKELAIGAFESNNGQGAIWILSLDANNVVVDKLKIAPGVAGFNESVSTDVNANGSTGGHFGHALVAAGDLNGDGVPDLITSANQYNDGVGYVIYLNSDKTVKTFTRINSDEGGFNLTLGTLERFGRSISIVDNSRADGKITVNMGGGAGNNSNGGAFYAMNFQACDYVKQEGNKFWNGGTTLFSNWNHNNQQVEGSLTTEQCFLKASETQGYNITAQETDGRCIIKSSDAVLADSVEGSSAYIRNCP